MIRGAIVWLLALAAAASAASALPDAIAVLGLLRDRVAAGEAWRLWTGHLVHQNAAHLLVDLAGMGLGTLGMIAPRAPRLTFELVVAAGAIGLALMAFHPRVAWYVGLSGVVHAFWGTALAERIVRGRGAAWAAPLLVALAAKVAWQTLRGDFPGQLDLPVVAVAHAWGLGIGTLTGGMVGLCARRKGRTT